MMVPTVVLLTVLISGLAMLLSGLYVRFRDIDHIWGLTRQLLFYVSPIFYVVAEYPAPVRPLLNASPLAAAFTEFRHAVIDPGAPSLSRADGGIVGAIVPILVALAIFAAGLLVFHRESLDAPEHI